MDMHVRFLQIALEPTHILYIYSIYKHTRIYIYTYQKRRVRERFRKSVSSCKAECQKTERQNEGTSDN